MLNRTLFSIYNHGKNPVSPLAGRASFSIILSQRELSSNGMRPINPNGRSVILGRARGALL